MAFKQLLPHTDLPLRNRTLHAKLFRKGSEKVDAKARNNPLKKHVLNPACVNESDSISLPSYALYQLHQCVKLEIHQNAF